MTFLKRLVKIRIIHCKRYELIGTIIFALTSFVGAYSIIVLKVPASPEQRGAEPVIAGIYILMFLVALGFTYWYLFKEKNLYLFGQYKKYEMRGNDSGIDQVIELSGHGKYDLTVEVIWKVRKQDIPPDRSFRLARYRKDNGVKAHIKMEFAPDNSPHQILKFEQQPDQSLNAGKIGTGKTLDKVRISCAEKISINITAQVERKEEVAMEHEEIFLIRVYNSLSLKEAFQPIPNMIVFD
jgi:hypothetical protein